MLTPATLRPHGPDGATILTDTPATDVNSAKANIRPLTPRFSKLIEVMKAMNNESGFATYISSISSTSHSSTNSWTEDINRVTAAIESFIQSKESPDVLVPQFFFSSSTTESSRATTAANRMAEICRSVDHCLSIAPAGTASGEWDRNLATYYFMLSIISNLLQSSIEKESGNSNDTALVVLGVLLARICAKSPIRMIIFADVCRNLCSICIPDFNRAIATALTERGRDGAVNGTQGSCGMTGTWRRHLPVLKLYAYVLSQSPEYNPPNPDPTVPSSNGLPDHIRQRRGPARADLSALWQWFVFSGMTVHHLCTQVLSEKPVRYQARWELALISTAMHAVLEVSMDSLLKYGGNIMKDSLERLYKVLVSVQKSMGTVGNGDGAALWKAEHSEYKRLLVLLTGALGKGGGVVGEGGRWAPSEALMEAQILLRSCDAAPLHPVLYDDDLCDSELLYVPLLKSLTCWAGASALCLCLSLLDNYRRRAEAVEADKSPAMAARKKAIRIQVPDTELGKIRGTFNLIGESLESQQLAIDRSGNGGGWEEYLGCCVRIIYFLILLFSI